ncbi:MAG: hypothetical protein FWG45_06015 [Oscillospiraceae bacterium]|nr:hypothetical protein [Oscillospiraceae bacterium]
MEENEKNGPSGMANCVGLYNCDFYATREDEGFVIRTYGWLDAIRWGIYSIGYIDNTGYRTIYLSAGFEDDISDMAISDGEFLYYMHSDGNLKRIDNNGEIKHFKAFENADDFYSVRELWIDATDDEITITSEAYFGKKASSIVIDVSKE